MKGIILAGGHGTRLYPLTVFTSKQLLPVYEKPMIYYPLSTLMLGGIREIAIISTPRDLPQYEKLLGNGIQWGLSITYIIQDKPRGLADAFIVSKKFIGKDNVSLILGDNIFYGNMRLKEIFGGFDSGALVFGYPVNDPERYGIIEFSDSGEVVGIVEKPEKPKSRYAIPGFYIYDNKVVNLAENLKPSSRGEIEITDLNLEYLKTNDLEVKILGRGIAWLDTGTASSLQDASSFIQSIEKRQSFKIGCPEEIALRSNFIGLSQFRSLIDKIPSCNYQKYLQMIYDEIKLSDGKREVGIGDLQ
jgi:glucose-1-phosphate thymidylyltransferase